MSAVGLLASSKVWLQMPRYRPSSRRRRRSPKQPTGDVMTVRQVAAQLGCAEATVLGWIAAGHLIASNVGQGRRRPRWRIRQVDLDTFLQRRRKDVPRPKRHRRPPPGTIEFY